MIQRQVSRHLALLFLLSLSAAHGQSASGPDTVYVSGKGLMYVLRGTVIDAASGDPVSDAVIIWKSYGGGEKRLASDAEGRFEQTLNEEFGWRSILYARHGEKVSQFVRLHREGKLAPVLALAEPATFSGLVTGDGASPVSGATVRLLMEDVFHDSSPFQDIVTGSDGRYSLTGLPPGRFGLALGHDTDYEHSLFIAQDMVTTTLEPGKETVRYFSTLPKARISGRVAGPNGEPVSNITFTLENGSRFDRLPTHFKTDEAGLFVAYVFPSKRERNIRIRHESLGSGVMHVPPLQSGDAATGVAIQLQGMAHVSGRVLGPDGEPVSGARIDRYAISAEDGRFDLGYRPLTPKGTISIQIAPPYRKEWWPGGRARGQFPTATNRTVLQWKRVEVSGRHGEALNVEVVLEPIPEQRTTVTRIVRGSVRNETGEPAAQVQVVVYEGLAEAGRWLEDMCPIVPPPPEPSPWRPRQTMRTGPATAVLLARVCTDANGAWEVRIPCGVLERHNWLGQENAGLNHVTVAASDGVTRWTALARFDVDGERSDSVTADLELGLIDDDLVMQVAVVDDAGKSLAGIAWLVGKVNGPFVTDANGHLTIPRLSSRVKLALQDPNYSIADVQVAGSIVPRPRPASDPDLRSDFWTGRPGEFSYSVRGPGVEPEPPYLKHGKRTVEYHFFDTREGSLTIVLTVPAQT